MINSTFGGFMTARQGMAAAQHGLNLTGHNLTNSATEGYTRQRIDQVSLNFNGSYRYASKYNVNIGNGVLVTGTSQLRDPFLDLRYRNEVAHAGEQGIKLEVLSDLQSILDEVKNAGDDTLGDGGIFNQLGDILAKLQQLSNEVGNKEFDNMVRSSCQALTTLFQSYDKRIQEVEDNLAYDLENVDVPRVNDILRSISELNKTIKSNEIMGDSALELKDQRNLLLDELSNYMKISVTYKPIQVSDSTVVDELTVSMVGSDGNRYALVADEQYRQLELNDMQNADTNLPGEYNIGLTALTPVDTELKAVLQNAMFSLQRAQKAASAESLVENYTKAHDAFAAAIAEKTRLENIINGYTDENGNPVPGTETAINEAKTVWEAAQAAYEADPTPALEIEAMNAEKEYNKAVRADQRAKEALTKYETGDYAAAQAAYETAVSNMPSDTAEFAALFTAEDGTVTLPDDLRANPTTKLTKGGGGQALADAIKAAEKNVAAALNNLEISELNGQAITSINALLVDGSLKGTLEMLNYSAEYDNPPNSIRGIGYYHNMLDTLAYEFATIMNEANNPDGVKQTNADGDTVDGPYDLFVSNNGEKIDAGNITLADGWVKNEYGITASRNPEASSGSNDNILHIISLFGKKLSFSASEDLMSKMTFEKGTGNAAITNTLNGMKPGDTITLDGKTYTFVNGASGANGEEFSDLASLQNAASKNGIQITKNATTGELTATAVDGFDLKNMVTVQGNQVSNLADIDINSLKYGDQIVIDGNTFTYKAPAETVNTAKNEFNDLTSLKTAAVAQNIKIESDLNTGSITSITRVHTNAETVSVDKAPNFKDLQDGNTIKLDNGVSPPVKLTYKESTTPLSEDEIKNGFFSTPEELMKAAAAQNIDMYVNPDTGEITSASTTGSSLFTGTFEEFFTNIGNTLGLDIQSTTEMLDNYTQLASTIAQNREAVTGVSLDEEAMNIMRYQQSYNASARLMTALDEMLNTLITNTGVAGR